MIVAATTGSTANSVGTAVGAPGAAWGSAARVHQVDHSCAKRDHSVARSAHSGAATGVASGTGTAWGRLMRERARRDEGVPMVSCDPVPDNVGARARCTW